jgi:hypothetical protein
MHTYNDIADNMFKTVGQSIGIHVMLLVVEHALWKTKQRYEEADLIKYSEDGIFLEGLKKLEPDKAKVLAHEFIMQVIASLGRLVGKQIAHQLIKQLHEEVIKEKGE